jgi:hypothetical protein
VWRRSRRSRRWGWWGALDVRGGDVRPSCPVHELLGRRPGQLQDGLVCTDAPAEGVGAVPSGGVVFG